MLILFPFLPPCDNPRLVILRDTHVTRTGLSVLINLDPTVVLWSLGSTQHSCSSRKDAASTKEGQKLPFHASSMWRCRALYKVEP